MTVSWEACPFPFLDVMISYLGLSLGVGGCVDGGVRGKGIHVIVSLSSLFQFSHLLLDSPFTFNLNPLPTITKTGHHSTMNKYEWTNNNVDKTNFMCKVSTQIASEVRCLLVTERTYY